MKLVRHKQMRCGWDVLQHFQSTPFSSDALNCCHLVVLGGLRRIGKLLSLVAPLANFQNREKRVLLLLRTGVDIRYSNGLGWTFKMAKSCICPFLPKGGSNVIYLNCETKFGIILSFHSILTLICKDLHILIFATNSSFQNFSHIWANQNEHFSGKQTIPR